MLREHPDHEEIVLEGGRLGEVVIETARRFLTPLAVPLMDLSLEKAALIEACGIAEPADSFHFTTAPALPHDLTLTRRMRAVCGAIGCVGRSGDLVPLGMAIGPFSLTTKLVADPITPVFSAATGVKPAEDPELAVMEAALAAAERMVTTYVDAQISAGAVAIIICEPAANTVYFSPRQLAESYATFDHFVMAPMRRLAARLERRGVGLVFHDCGELTDGMVERFATLRPVMLSLGSSRKLWEDAARVPTDTVLYGNLPTKNFYAAELTTAEVERITLELIDHMRGTGHAFIVGSECDVLSVPGVEQEILEKVGTFMRCGCVAAPRPPTPEGALKRRRPFSFRRRY